MANTMMKDSLEVPVRRTPSRAALRYECGADQVVILTFDRPGSAANVFDEGTLLALDRFLAGLEKRDDLRGVILQSAKPSIFMAGADIDSVLAVARTNPNETSRLIQLGQGVFHRLEQLSIPTVAAIHGACLGGGYELALACDYRVASAERVTTIGLPEVQLGIVPAWGGCTRLPKLVGLARALDVILGGRALRARKARRMGLIDMVVPRESLLKAARSCLRRGKAGQPQRRIGSRFPLDWVTRTLAGRRLARSSGGLYPALDEALNLISSNLRLPMQRAMENERRAIERLIVRPETRNLITLFKWRERAKKLGTSACRRTRTLESRELSVIGGGVMGAGIAHWCASSGMAVTMSDVSQQSLASGMDLVEKRFRKAVQRGVFSRVEAARALDRVTPYHGAYPMSRYEVVIEAAVEKMNVKRAIFKDLEGRVNPETILATNTSALSVSELAEGLAHPERVIGVHFFNPVHRMPLVEVVMGNKTSDEALQRTLALVGALKKLPVVVRDRPGFIVNRLLLPYMCEAGKLLEQGVDGASIDRAMRAFGMPMGPLRLLDEVGLDVAVHVADTLVKAFGRRMAPPELLQAMTEKGDLGRKSGCGFYDYRRSGKAHIRIDRGSASRRLSAEVIQERLVYLIINEGARCLEEGVVSEPRDVDFAMVMGTEFAPFRGGPLRYADTLGSIRVVEALESMGVPPAGLLLDMSASNSRFYAEETNEEIRR